MQQKMIQIEKLRAKLGADGLTPPDEIVRPKGMRRKIFSGRISRLKILEKRARQLVREDFAKWLERTYI